MTILTPSNKTLLITSVKSFAIRGLYLIAAACVSFTATHLSLFTLSGSEVTFIGLLLGEAQTLINSKVAATTAANAVAASKTA